MLNELLYYINNRIAYLRKKHRTLEARELEMLRKSILDMIEDYNETNN